MRMPRTEGEQQGSADSSRGRKQQQEEEEDQVEHAGNFCWQEGCGSSQLPAQTDTTQVSFPFLLGPRGSFISTSQLQVILLQQCGTKEMNKQLSQHRPSVLRRATQTQIQDLSSSPASDPASMAACKVEFGGCIRGTSPQAASLTSQDTGHTPWPRSSGLKQGSSHSGQSDSPAAPPAEGSTVLFVKGQCRWPGCKEVFKEYPSFLQHLCVEHRLSDHSASQWRMQRDMVQHLENQLTVEKQRLLAMQLHLHLPEPRSIYSLSGTQKEGRDREESLRARPPLSRVKDHTPPHRTHGKEGEPLPQGYWHIPVHHTLPGFIPSIDCYKYNNIRPPYTYADLIRWAILESPDKQLTLSEIYHWFTKMFFYFRHNTATWKNAVRHNLSLHKCFVRVEGAKGAVWTVNEAEFQKRKGQKFTRERDTMWFTPSSFLCPQECRMSGPTGSPGAEQHRAHSQGAGVQ
ncbi:forkhead box protein P3-like isoform X1 [Anguilla anguilla]|uniref:forkhead box protein P3-like isoform X1 n=2 Tax=Anguilla anguilla TaxID=7936 RepID=UPI0015ADA10E|nr:forkhead box protein P3-like isoform X1 [Anguilla anguilla]